ncbi:MAG: zinc-ribbon domain-containing protein [Proteobacteria bacterium]|nr:zinc-ribbon domain-containing protein [Pseudomonadota bacterium]
MIEIVCPSCQARYQLPDGSIGPDGRKVSCSSCSHKWRANAEGAVAAASTPVAEPKPEPVAEPKPEPVAEPEPETVAESASMAAVAAPGDESAAFSPPPPAAAGDRKDQMAAIRQMLTDLKDSADAAPEPVPESRPEPVAPTPTMRKRDEDEDIDALKSRIDGVDKLGRTKKGEAAPSGYNAAKLRRLHEKRAKKLQRSRERRKKSGAFLTGFTLMAMVTATMVGLYVLQPQIIDASPRMKPALTEYVVTVDRYRVELNEKTAEWRAWLTERIGALGDDEG